MKLLEIIKSISLAFFLFLMPFFGIKLKADDYYNHYHNHYYPRFGDYRATMPVYCEPYNRRENRTYYGYGKGFYAIPYNYGEGYGYISHYPYGRYDDYGPFLGVNDIAYRQIEFRRK